MIRTTSVLAEDRQLVRYVCVCGGGREDEESAQILEGGTLN